MSKRINVSFRGDEKKGLVDIVVSENNGASDTIVDTLNNSKHKNGIDKAFSSVTTFLNSNKFNKYRCEGASGYLSVCYFQSNNKNPNTQGRSM